jgi:conjugative transfer signal peptidase TraF
MKPRCWILRIATAATGCAILIGVELIGNRLPAVLGYCLNLTRSEPPGIYRVIDGGNERGSLVWLKQPAGPAALILRRYAPANIPLIKRVAAIPGDLVQLDAHGLSVNRMLWPSSAALAHDAEGRSLPTYCFGAYRVRCGQLWVMSDHPRGIDSRYFGPVSEASVISRVLPVITWSSATTSQVIAFTYAISIAAVAVLLATMNMNIAYAQVIRPRELQQGMRRLQ